MLAGLVAVGVGGPPYEVDEPVEGVVDVAAEHVEVGDEGLGVDVVGVGGGRLARGRQVGALGALQHLGHREPGCRLGVGGVAVDQLLVLRDGRVDVALAQGVLGGGVPRVGRRLRGFVTNGCGRTGDCVAGGDR